MKHINLVRWGGYLGPASQADESYLAAIGVLGRLHDEDLASLRRKWGPQGLSFGVEEGNPEEFRQRQREFEAFLIAVGRYLERNGLEEATPDDLLKVVKSLGYKRVDLEQSGAS